MWRDDDGEPIHWEMDGPATTQEFVFGYEQYVEAIDEMIDALLGPYEDDADRDAKWLRLSCRSL